ncbi:MAG: GFA family protein [Rhodobacter sp.]|nr:GFA family protein [Rhodobacter sp.]
MRLEGSCHCGAVRFAVEAPHPVPYMLCYCSICRKTAGGGGYAINLGAKSETMRVEGEARVRTYNAVRDGTPSTLQRSFCSLCGSALWAYSPKWPDLIHPHASAIDTDLPLPPERAHIMLGSRANWAEPCLREGDTSFDAYPNESLADWHDRMGKSQ